MRNDLLLGTRTGLRVSELALGTARLGTAEGRATDTAEVQAAHRAFADAGGTLFDTSSAYQAGGAETALGNFLQDAGREAFVVISKYTRTTSATPALAAIGNHRRAMLAEVEGSLRRLRTDRIDVYLAHYDDEVTPIDEIVRGFEDLGRAGKIVYAGLSNFPAWRASAAATLADARGWSPMVLLQMQYNLLERAIEREHLPLAAAHGMAMLGWSPLAGAQLLKRESAVRTVLTEIARELSATPEALAVAWVLAKGVIPVIGPRTKAQLLGNLAATEVHPRPEQLRRLDEVSALELGYPYDLLAAQRPRK